MCDNIICFLQNISTYPAVLYPEKITDKAAGDILRKYLQNIIFSQDKFTIELWILFWGN